MSLEVLNRQRKVRLDLRRLKARLDAAMASAGVQDAEVDLVLVSDRAIRVLNRRWRGKDRPTDCLSFPSGKAGLSGAGRGAGGRRGRPIDQGPADLIEERHLGDIVISAERALAQGAGLARPGTPMQRALEDEVVHLFVHSLLHLLGYDHETDAEARRMRAVERRVLRGTVALAIPTPVRP